MGFVERRGRNSRSQYPQCNGIGIEIILAITTKKTNKKKVITMTGTSPITVLVHELAETYGWEKKVARYVVNTMTARLDVDELDESGRYPNAQGAEFIRTQVASLHSPKTLARIAEETPTVPAPVKKATSKRAPKVAQPEPSPRPTTRRTHKGTAAVVPDTKKTATPRRARANKAA